MKTMKEASTAKRRRKMILVNRLFTHFIHSRKENKQKHETIARVLRLLYQIWYKGNNQPTAVNMNTWIKPGFDSEGQINSSC